MTTAIRLSAGEGGSSTLSGHSARRMKSGLSRIDGYATCRCRLSVLPRLRPPELQNLSLCRTENLLIQISRQVFLSLVLKDRQHAPRAGCSLLHGQHGKRRPPIIIIDGLSEIIDGLSEAVQRAHRTSRSKQVPQRCKLLPQAGNTAAHER